MTENEIMHRTTSDTLKHRPAPANLSQGLGSLILVAGAALAPPPLPPNIVAEGDLWSRIAMLSTTSGGGTSDSSALPVSPADSFSGVGGRGVWARGGGEGRGDSRAGSSTVAEAGLIGGGLWGEAAGEA